HLESFIARFKAKASKAKQAQSRMKRLAKLTGTAAVRAERSLHIEFPAPAKLPNSLIRLNHADAGYGAVRILQNVGFGLEAGDRVGLLGPNGAGKSTLVKTLVGELPLLAGERNAHPDLRIGYFAQHTVESLHRDLSPIDHLRELSPAVQAQALRDFLGKWNFPGDRAFENIDAFSGGERARLALALIAWRQPNVLLLDEPTNHLDLDMREALAEALSDFDGAIVLVSHDRHLIGLVCETYWRVAHGRVEAFDGDLDQYAAWLRSRPSQQRPAQTTLSVQTVANANAANKSAKPNPHKLARAEAQLADLESLIAALDGRIADPSFYATAGAHASELTRQRAALGDELASLENHLLSLYEAA
ncbi:MAG: ABC-F family ATP-binding cassette domain-containing protein, partial [Rhodanobacteraceae bacterium]